MILRFNPFAVVDHNQHRWPRVAFHACHVALGLTVWLLASRLHTPWAWTLAAGFLVACLDKCIWFDWRGHRVHWTGFAVGDPWDFASDLGLTLLGAFLPSWRVALPVYYALSLVNGT